MQVPAGATYPVPAHKWLVALAVMLGTALEVLDTSIVNVALPHMQGAFSASVDEIAWVLASYLIANRDHDSDDGLDLLAIRALSVQPSAMRCATSWS